VVSGVTDDVAGTVVPTLVAVVVVVTVPGVQAATTSTRGRNFRTFGFYERCVNTEAAASSTRKVVSQSASIFAG